MSDVLTQQRRIVVDGIFNLRDLGGYQSPVGPVAWRRLYRADGLHRLPAPSLDQLQALELRTVIDLRTKAELSGHGSLAGREVGARYHHMPMIETVWDATRFEAVADAAAFLADRYIDMLLEGGMAIAQVIAVLAHPAAYPVVFHCAAGKDRTGVLAAVVLSLLGVDEDTIVEDYSLSGDAMVDMIAWARVAAPDALQAMSAQPRAFLEAPPAAMRGLLQWVLAEYGSMRSYVLTLGVDESMVDAVVANLIDRAAA